MSAKSKCPEGCGTFIQAGEQETVDRLMAKHVAENHGTLEQRYTKTLTRALALLVAAGTGVTVSKADARSVAKEIGSLLKIPVVPMFEDPQEKKDDSSVSGSSVSETVLPGEELHAAILDGGDVRSAADISESERVTES